MRQSLRVIFGDLRLRERERMLHFTFLTSRFAGPSFAAGAGATLAVVRGAC